MPPLVKSTAGNAISVRVEHRPAGPGIDPRHRLRRRHRAARTEAVQLASARRLPQVHAVAAAGTRRRQGPGCTAGAGDARIRPIPGRRSISPPAEPRRTGCQPADARTATMIARPPTSSSASVRAGHRQAGLAVGGRLVLTLVVATAYLFLGALRVNPFASSYRVTVELPESGGPAAESGRRRCAVCRSAGCERCEITAAGVNAVVERRLDGADPGVERRAGVGPVAGGRAVHRLRRRIRRRALSARRQRHRAGPGHRARSAWPQLLADADGRWPRSTPPSSS